MGGQVCPFLRDVSQVPHGTGLELDDNIETWGTLVAAISENTESAIARLYI